MQEREILMVRTVLRLFRIVKGTLTLGVICVMLLVTVVGLAVHSVALATQLTLAAKNVAEAVARAKARERAKARVRRFAIAGAATVPVAGILAAPAIAGSFEVADFNEWRTDNPEGGFGDYACEAGGMSAELVDEVLQELPEPMRPSPDKIRSWMPRCGVSLEDQPWELAK